MCPSELRLDVAELNSNPVLLGLQQVERDGSGVVGVEQFLPLGGEDGLLGFELLPLGGGSFLQCVKVFEYQLLDVVAEVR